MMLHHRPLRACSQAAHLLPLLLLVFPRRRIAEADVLWRQLCIQRFNTPPDLSSPNMRWREVYR
jgi:hypothetical protein